MEREVIKRDGTRVIFNKEKIAIAIMKAVKQCGGTDWETALSLADKVTEKIFKEHVYVVPTVEQVQDTVEKVLIEEGHARVAKEYILYRDKRGRARNMQNKLIQTIGEMMFSASKDNDLKRENANIDADTSMGTMLKIGSEASKYFYNNCLLPKHIAKAHIDGDIHIHDLDFYGLTETCLLGDSVVTVKKYREVEDDLIAYPEKEMTLSEALDEYYEDDTKYGSVYIDEGCLWVKDIAGFVSVSHCFRRLVDSYLSITLSNGVVLCLTGEHKVPVMRGSANVVLFADMLKVGDALFGVNGNVSITSIECIKRASTLVYDITTSTGYFIANDIWVHNCCQIDLKKLFTNGFSTGTGYIREPNDIYSYAALACIAIQANQNEMHGGQSLPKFDYDLAPGVAKTFIKELASQVENVLFENRCYEQDAQFDSAVNVVKRNLLHFYQTNGHIMTEDGLAFWLKQFELSDWATEEELTARWNMAISKTDKRTHQAMEALVHNLNTMRCRAGAQVPFSSINFGTDVSDEGRMVSKNLLLATSEGMGMGETPEFPISIFKLKTGVNYNPEDPNYDLFMLACQVSAKRLFPNFQNLDATYNAEGYDGTPESEVATMGCVGGASMIDFKMGSTVYRMEIADVYEKYADTFGEYRLSNDKCSPRYVDVKGRGFKIKDSSSPSEYVECFKLIRNVHETHKWFKIQFANGSHLLCTSNHPLPVLIHTDNKGSTVGEVTFSDVSTNRVFVENIKVGDFVLVDREYKVATEVTSKVDVDDVFRFTPSYDVETESDHFDVNGINSHNCRTRVYTDIHGISTSVSRGNLSFTSVNLPRLAIKSHGNVAEFFKRLEDIFVLCKEQLLHRFRIQCAKHVYNYPFLMGQGVWLGSDSLFADDSVKDVLKHGTLSIGFIGLAEALVSLLGMHHGESDEAQKLGLEIVRYMRSLTDKFSKETDLNWSLLGTPAEGLSGRFVAIDKQKFGIIKGVTDREYYTNSSHVPVYFPISVRKKVDIEAPYHALENGGHISYVELDGDTAKNVKAFMQVIRYMHDKNMGYYSINHPNDFDPVCGYTGVIDETCPRCGRHEGEGIPLAKLREIEKLYGLHTESYLPIRYPEAEDSKRNSNSIDDLLN